MTEKMTLETYRQAHANRKGRRNKHNAVKVQIDGYTFDSKAEAQRYRELKLMQAGGVISGLEVHPTYTLQEGFTLNNGRRFRAMKHSADFRYREKDNDLLVVEDVKGHETAGYKLRRKLLLYRYGLRIDYRTLYAKKARGGYEFTMKKWTR